MPDLEKVIDYFQAALRMKNEHGFCILPFETVEDTIELLKAHDVPETNAGEWISVKDRLPEHGKRYLIYATSEGGKNHRITTAAYGGHFALSGRCAYWKVTHWMPLPEPPKEES